MSTRRNGALMANIAKALSAALVLSGLLLLAGCVSVYPVSGEGGLHCVTWPPACERCLTHTFYAPENASAMRRSTSWGA